MYCNCAGNTFAQETLQSADRILSVGQSVTPLVARGPLSGTFIQTGVTLGVILVVAFVLEQIRTPIDRSKK